MPRSFTPTERETIRNRLIAACGESWTQLGYRKTSVDALCRQADISKGAFYLFFESKESLFCQVLCGVQQRIYDQASQIMAGQPGRDGVAQALRFVYREYARNNFLHESAGKDYAALIDKLGPQQREQIERQESLNRSLFLRVPGLALRLPEEMTASILYALLMGVRHKDVLPRHEQVFEFLLMHVIDDLYESSDKSEDTHHDH